MKNTGADAETYFEQYWTKRGHCQRLRDKKDLMGLNKGMRLADFSKPSDFLVSSQTEALHYAEVKSTNHATLFPFSSIRPAQSNAALQEAKRGDRAYWFYIFSYELGKWFVMSCSQYALLVGEGRRSVKFEELETWDR